MKKIRLLSIMSFLLILLSLSACSLLFPDSAEKFDRDKVEAEFDFLAKVYPTPTATDLFEKFPKGFKLNYSVTETSVANAGNIDYSMELQGKPDTKEIIGIYKKEDYSSRPSKVIEEKPVRYIEGQGIVNLDGSPINPTLSKVEFLFTKLTLNRKIISKLEVRNYFKNPVSTDEKIDYHFYNDWAAEYLGLDKKERLELSIDFLHETKPYESKVIITADNNSSIFETIYENE